jgi:hypothetical protein
MMIGPIDSAQRIAARAAGLSYLITLATVVYVNFGIHDRLIGENNAETARKILAHEQLFRIGIVGDLVCCAGVVVLLTALYVILKPTNRGLALLAALCRFIFMLMWLVMTLHLFDALRLIKSADSLQAFDAAQLQVLASFNLGTRFDYYYVGLLFGASVSTVCAYLWFKSRLIARALAAFGMVSSAFCVACTLVFYICSDLDKIVNLWWFDTPMGIFDITEFLAPIQGTEAGHPGQLKIIHKLVQFRVRNGWVPIRQLFIR